VTRWASSVAILAVLAAAAANVAYLTVEPLDGMSGSDASGRIAATGTAAAAALSAGWLAARPLPRLLLTLASVLLLLAAGVMPVLALGAPILLVVLTGLARDVAAVTAHLPEVRVRLLTFTAVALGGPPLVALAHLLA
jgi:hypothetical protein